MNKGGFDSISVRADDMCRLAERQLCPQFSGFLSPEEQALFERAAFQHRDVFCLFFGGFADAERAVAGVFPCDIYSVPETGDETLLLEEMADIAFVCISGSGFVNISHRDVLGSIMGLGLKREAVGDIIVSDDGRNSYVAVLENVKQYICANLERVGRDKVKVKPCEKELVPEKVQKFSDMSLTLASLRIDALISSALNISRDKAKKLIAAGKVAVNHLECLSCDKDFAENDVITVKGEGKFKVDGILGLSAKGRQRVIVRKYL